jgi:putative transposase
MIKSIKVMLIPNNKQKSKMFLCAGVGRFAYNWVLAKQQENYKNGGKFLTDNNLRKEFTQLKKNKEYEWLNNYSNNISKQAIKDACSSYKRFFKKQAGFPKFKSKKKNNPSFYVDNMKIKFTKTHVKLEKISESTKNNKRKINWIRLSEHNRIPTDCKYSEPRVTFDGINWFISVGIECESEIESSINYGIGIDLGIRDLATCSDDHVYKNINKTIKIKKIEKKRRRLQRQISKKYELNKDGRSYKKTSNIKKLEKQLLKVNHRLTNIRKNHLHQVTTDIVNRKPMFIVLENLNISKMMKNRHLSKAIQQQGFFEFYRQIKYKCLWKNIKFIRADKWYPSSKTCSRCGYIKKQLKLSEREYVCGECGYIIDRDKNASINLMKYGIQSVI